MENKTKTVGKMMKKIIIIFVLLFIPCLSFAQTHIPSGDVSGTWTIDGSPYIVDGNITVPVDSTLIIEPGVNIIFSGSYKFKVYGRLLSEGTEIDTIYFTAQDTTIGWKGLKFYDTDINQQDSSKVKYCRLEYGRQGSLIYCSNSSCILIKNSAITNNLDGRGISCGESSPTLINVTISNNISQNYGGGIYCTESSNPHLVNVTISGNSAAGAGGVYCSYNSNPMFENVIIADNYPQGICCTYSSSPILNNVTIIGNEGGGIACSDNSNPILNNVIISNNTVWGGLFCINSSPVLTNVLISGNSGGEFGGGIYSEGTGSLLLQDVIITGNSALDMGGGVALIGADMIMVNGIVADNYADDAGGIYCHDGVSLVLTNVTVSENSVGDYGIVGGVGCEFDCILNITNSIVWNNDPMDIYLYGYGCESYITYSDIGGEGWQGIGNINTDPLFADPENGDFHLTWANFPIQDSTMSPCIDAGNPNSPLDPDSTRADMGAYYFDQAQNGVSNIPIPKSEFMLYQNYPNPFNPKTTIKFELPYNKKDIFLEIFNIKGEKIRLIKCQNQVPIIWDGRDQLKNQVSSGIYLYRIKTDGSVSKTKKMIIIR